MLILQVKYQKCGLTLSLTPTTTTTTTTITTTTTTTTAAATITTSVTGTRLPTVGPAPFLFSVHLHGMTFPFLSDRNPLWTYSSVN